MKPVWIAATNLRRIFRYRASIFFIFVFPMLLILILGATFGGSSNPRLGVVSGGSGLLGEQLVKELRATPRLHVVTVGPGGHLVSQVERDNLVAGLIIPPGCDADLRAGRQVTLLYLGRLDTSSQQMAETVRGAVAKQAALVGAARFATGERAVATFDAGLAAAVRTSALVPAVTVSQTTAGKSALPQNLGQFDESSWDELLLFLFLTSLTGAVALIETRRLGVARRELATPTSAFSIIAGETLGRVLIGFIQAIFIIGGTALLFGVHWGSLVGVVAVVLLFVLVGAGSGIFVGTLFRNEQQAQGLTLLLGLGLAALGGCMVPLEVFSSGMKHVAHLTPHAWANDAFNKLIAHGAAITGILPQLGVLAGFAAVLLLASSLRLRRVLAT